MTWIPVAAWGAAVVIAVIVLGFAGYEIWWKAARLQQDVRRLTALGAELTSIQHDLLAAQRRVADTSAAQSGPAHVSPE
jgi:hypothetical protein